MQFPSHCVGRLSSQADNAMGYVRIIAIRESGIEPRSPDYSFDDIILCLLPLCYLQIAEW